MVIIGVIASGSGSPLYYQQLSGYVDDHEQHKRPRHSNWGGEGRKIPLHQKVRCRTIETRKQWVGSGG